jgi:uncharacterized membrane protein YkoI
MSYFSRSTAVAAAFAAVLGSSAYAAESAGQPLLDMPDSVKEAIRNEAGGKMVSSIELETENGKQVYEVNISQEGLDRTVRIDPDGVLISSTDWNKRVDDGKNRAAQAWQSTKQKTKEAWEKTKHATAGGVERARGYMGGHEDLSLADLPAPVRKTIEREAAGKTVEDIDHQMKDGKHFYQANVKISDSENVKLKVAEDGTLVEKH